MPARSAASKTFRAARASIEPDAATAETLSPLINVLAAGVITRAFTIAAPDSDSLATRMNLTQTGLATLLVSLLLAAQSAGAETIRLRIGGVRSADGRVKINVYAPPKKPVTERIIAASRGTMEVELEVPPGAYAIILYHDENSSGKLERGGLLGMPTEGYAFSNDAPVRFGPPSFEAMRIDVAPGARVVTAMQMRYPRGQ